MAKIAYYSDFIEAYKDAAGCDEITVADELNLRNAFRRNLRYGLLAGAWPEHEVIEERAVVNDVLPFSETSKQDIEELWEAYATNPLLSPKPKPLDVRAVAAGWAGVDGLTSVYAVYLPVYTAWKGNDYSASTSYAAKDVVFYGLDFYEAKSSTTGNLPTNATYWTKKSYSSRLTDYLAASCYADNRFRDDAASWQVAINKAYGLLSREQFNLGRNNIRFAPRVKTNNGQQNRR